MFSFHIKIRKNLIRRCDFSRELFFLSTYIQNFFFLSMVVFYSYAYFFFIICFGCTVRYTEFQCVGKLRVLIWAERQRAFILCWINCQGKCLQLFRFLSSNIILSLVKAWLYKTLPKYSSFITLILCVCKNLNRRVLVFVLSQCIACHIQFE